MKFYFRLSEKNKEIKMTDNVLFIPKESKEITLFPLPTFLKKPKCKCGKKANFLAGTMLCICSNCINEKLEGTKIK